MSFWRRFLNHFIPHHSNAYRPHILKRGWLVLFLALVLATEGFLVASLVARQSGGSFLAAVIQSELVSLTNAERVNNHVSALTANALLDAAAQAKAEDMAAKGYFSHQSPDGRQPWDFISAAGYEYQYAGENLAVRFVDSKDVVDAWMASPTHHANIVKAQYREIGIGIAQGTYKGAPATFVVQYFGKASPQALARAPAPAALPTSSAPTTAAPIVAAEPADLQVLGAEVGPSYTEPLNAAARQLPRLLSDPRSSTAWILGGIATLLILVLGIAFIMHLQVQANDLLVPGAAVAAIALFFVIFNGSFLSAGGNQAASVAGAGMGEVVITPAAASVER